jgi:smad nuclear-interacting protein 1
MSDQYGRASRWGQHKNLPPVHRAAPAVNSYNANTTNNNTRLDKTAVAPHGSLDQKAVSDADALRALLSSAEAREQERSQVNQRTDTDNRNNDGNKRSRFDNHNKNRPNHDNDGDSNKRHRGGQDNDRHNNNNDSYYGPQQNNNNGAGSGRDDRHRDHSRPRRVVEKDEVDSKNNSNREGEEEEAAAEKPVPDIKPNFGLSGTLTKDEGSSGSNVYKGIVLKFREPPEARAPNTLWRFYVFKGQELLETLHISKQSAYLMGRNADICDVPMAHPSLSGQHAVLQYRALPTKQDPSKVSCQPYIMDLESTNGTFLNTVRIDAARYYQLKKGDVLTFGASKREFVLLTENTTSIK